MASFDDSSSISPVIALAVTTVSDNTAQVGAIIDTNDFESFTYYVLTDTLADADATFATTFREGDDSGLSDGTAVSTDDLVGNADFDFNDDDSIKQIGYVGKKRFVEMTITPSNNSSAATFPTSKKVVPDTPKTEVNAPVVEIAC